jgi:transposase
MQSSGKGRKKYSPQFKLDRALEAVKNGNLSEISRKYGVSVNILSNWRAQLIEKGVGVFETSPDQEKNSLKAKIARLEQMLGKKEVELNLLKNFSDFYESQNTA